ncbi:hypothetical protein [Bradyrhizobium diazoefficiens]|uniref:hypothetical protein n=1 Tax=Bradyrhizobium diazoefficiens TaxID=1355477 RepID=UPI00271541A7|nr:hypothetical protein [Bradyrhizobium diazoefficiens]WLA54410.1 hypothetical protein QIH81_28165 [Bradyrhizobium diazoefficiens]
MASSQSGVLFDHIPEEIDVPVIVEVTIVSREADICSPDHTPLAVMNARVERVVRGTLDSDALEVLPTLALAPELAQDMVSRPERSSMMLSLGPS